VGLDRVTVNFQMALGTVDDAVCVSDQEALDTAQWLLRNEGLFVGSSSALNIAAAARTAKLLLDAKQQGRNRPKVVTIVCDHGSRHLSRFWNQDYVTRYYGLHWPPEDVVPAWLL
jgi:cysteine synthase A